jgi:radical SAM superfamily enzyme YgiQ (UPF0313 family)
MKVLLISGNREEMDIRVPALGLACIAASCQQAGHNVCLLDLLIEKDPKAAVEKAVRDLAPEIIGVSVRNIDDQRMQNPRFLLEQARETVEWCRGISDAPIVLGGAGFSILPQPILDYVGADMGIQGEGETLFCELLKRLKRGEQTEGMPGLYRKGNRKGKMPAIPRFYTGDLDTLPLPDPSWLARSLRGAENAPVPVQTRRGCPLLCSYCSTPTIEGKRMRRRSPEAVVSWLGQWVQEGFRSFYFVDNTFNLPPSYAMQLCSKIINAGLDISWKCIFIPAGCQSGLIEIMAKAGCKEVSLGFESGSGGMLRRMHKPFTLEDVRRASNLFRQHRIRRMGFLLLGGPGETRESVEESLAFAESLDLDALRLSIGIRIYPDTEIAKVAREEGWIASDEDLLNPRFYIVPELAGWLYETIAARLPANPHWIL